MLSFKPWQNISVYRDRKITYEFLKDVGTRTKKALREGIRNPPKTGRMYGSHQASSPVSYREYPANRTGRLVRSVRKITSRHDTTVGTTAFYGRFLADGTRKMNPRKMSAHAMKEILPPARASLHGWIRFIRE